MSGHLINAFIIWVVRERGDRKREVIRLSDDTHVFWRWEFAWWDEVIKGDGTHYNRPPWWRPFNIFLHCWNPNDDKTEAMHDHPRWSVTICLRGKIVEHTPWRKRTLVPGSIMIRSRKAIHEFSVPDGYRGKTWTLFIVGRRNYSQNTYLITSHAGEEGQVAQ